MLTFRTTFEKLQNYQTFATVFSGSLVAAFLHQAAAKKRKRKPLKLYPATQTEPQLLQLCALKQKRSLRAAQRVLLRGLLRSRYANVLGAIY